MESDFTACDKAEIKKGPIPIVEVDHERGSF